MFIDQNIKNFSTFVDEIILYKNIIPFDQSKNLFTTLFSEVNWRQETISLFGRQRNIPRLSAWYGDVPYVYSGLKMKPNPLTPLLCNVKNYAEKLTKNKYNSVLINLYRDGQDSMSWHSDDEAQLGLMPAIASISLGAERTFKLRHKKNLEKELSVNLKNGSLFFMAGETQSNWQHSLPKTRKKIGPRINLTFRFTLG